MCFLNTWYFYFKKILSVQKSIGILKNTWYIRSLFMEKIMSSGCVFFKYNSVKKKDQWRSRLQPGINDLQPGVYISLKDVTRGAYFFLLSGKVHLSEVSYQGCIFLWKMLPAVHISSFFQVRYIYLKYLIRGVYFSEICYQGWILLPSFR